MNTMFDRFYFRLSAQFETTFHAHPEYEINYIYDGRCKIVVGNRRFDMESGCLLIMDGKSPHGPIMEEACTHTMLRFDAASMRALLVMNPDIDLFRPFHVLRNHNWRLKGNEKEEVERILNQIEHDCGHSDLIRVLRMRMHVMNLLLFIFDHSRELLSQQKQIPTHKEMKVREVMQFIDENYMHDLNMDTISREVCFSKFYLARLFKELTGQTIFEYVNRQRIVRAKLFLIEEKATPVTEICYRVGFKQLEHFSKNFKRLVGVSPERYRKSHGMM